jgi:uncharacterized protein (TIGR03067 family)
MSDRMLRWGGWALAVIVVMGFEARSADDEKVTGDLKQMQGTWVSGPDAPAESRWVFEGSKVKTTINGQEYGSKVKLDSKASPRAADFEVTDGPEEAKGKTALGIYKIDGDTLTICVSIPGNDARPTEFKAIEDATHLFELKRDKKP